MKMRLFPMLMLLGLLCVPGMTSAQRVQQKLGRGVVVAKNGTAATLTWRRLAQEPEDATYNIYVNGTKLNSAPLKNTNFATTAAKVPVGSEVEVKVMYDGKERSVGVPHKVKNYDLRNMFMSIRFDKSPLTAANYSTDYVWPADLDGDGEMDYVVNRKSVTTGLDNYVEAYLSSGEHLWTVKLGPNELSCAGQDDMILAYDMDCDGKADVVMQTSDGTQFWDADNKTYGLFVNGNTTGDTDGDGIIDYEKQGTKNAPRYMTVVDGMTGKEKASVEQTYNSSYNRTNKSALMGDEYNKHVGHVGVFYNDGVHPAVIMEWHTRNSNGSHNYHNSAFAYDFSGGKAGEWKELFCKNTGGPAFHHIRIADVDGDGKDEMLTGGYTMDDNGSTLNNPGISHGDRFRTSDIDPERPGLETFAIQQNAGDMLGQILYDAATGKAIKKWYLSGVGDVGR
ncbi:MAG: cellulosome protein, partial [Bacteroidaceae bacterium]|nr:cellulosome protein [Bacteroidaceae bacterium]